MMQQTPHQRNGEIELARFLVALVIVNYHSASIPGCPNLFAYGQIGVEFFFLLSGFLMAASLHKKESLPIPSFREVNRETAHFLWRKLSSFYPELAISCVLGCIFFACVHHADPIIMTVGKTIRTFTANICLLETSGFGCDGINGVVWYLASMMWSMAILYPLYRWTGLNTILPAICLVSLSPFFAGSWSGDNTEIAFLMSRENIRGFCEIVLGASLFPVVMIVRRFDLRRWMRACLTLVKMGCYAVFLIDAVMFIPRNGGGKGLVLVALMLLLVLSFSRVCLSANLYQHRLIFWLGRLSLPLFLSHLLYAHHLGLVVSAGLSPVAKLLLYNACSFATAVLVMYLAQYVRRFFKEHRNFFLRSSAPAVGKQG